MTHYLINFIVATLAVIAFLYAVFVLLKQNPQLRGLAVPQSRLSQSPGLKLVVESVLDLEPRKRLYVVAYGPQRYMIATSMDKTELLATLPSAEIDLESVLSQSINPSQGWAPTGEGITTPPMGSDSGLMARFGYSLRTVLIDRFSRPGGR